MSVLDPFGDYEAKGYLRNVFKEKTFLLLKTLKIHLSFSTSMKL